ncbi:MAG: hypothetical protein HY832_02640 [Candidatus Aenigmarchaeota archaeon]|nr:hypothetical protein [Candidatus Aenigmarchaeota archaeon]
MKLKKSRRENILGFFSSASGGGAIAGAHNVCHALCIGASSALAIVGISVSSTALMFLEEYALPFWVMGLFFFIINMILYFITGHIAKKLTIFNAGMLIVGFPFVQRAAFAWMFWISGMAFVAVSVGMFMMERNFFGSGKSGFHGKK